MPWKSNGDSDQPFVDFETGGTVVVGYPTPEIRIDLIPMIFNDRVVVTHKDDYPSFIMAGFCYDKGQDAAIAAQYWVEHWDEHDVPLGFKKEAFNEMPSRIGKGSK